jgi:UDPglucose 6-dehydrogenase
MFQLGIIGGGFVGGATSLLQSDKVNCIIYDLDKNRCKPQSTSFDDILQTEAIFICVWTPITTTEEEYGKCNTKIVESIVKQLKDSNYKGYIIVRSTVPVGFCESQGVYFMPEFLTEKNWKNDFLNCEKWIFGLNMESSEEEKRKFERWMTSVIFSSNVNLKNVCFVDSNSAEYIKYFRNCFLATKVSFCNEMYEFAKAKDIDYEDVIDLVTDDKRIGKSHTSVPGPDYLRGFGGHCFPKDFASLQYQMNQVNVRCDITNAAIKRNNEIDRPEKDWLNY